MVRPNTSTSKTSKARSAGIVKVDVCNPNYDPITQIMINLLGPSLAGKTFAAATISEYWPKRFPPSKKVMLRDTLHVSHDAAATAGLYANKIRFPYVISTMSLIGADRKSGRPKCNDILEASEMITDGIREICEKDPDISNVIHDTMSSLDRFFVAFWSHDDNAPTDNRDERDTRAMYGAIFHTHLQYHTACLMLPVDVTSLFLFHGRIIGEASDGGKGKTKEQKKKENIVRLRHDVSIVPQVTGQGLDPYTNHASVEFACLPTEGGKGKAVERWLYTVPTKDYRAKNRFEGILQDKEPVDLRDIINRIRKSGA